MRILQRRQTPQSPIELPVWSEAPKPVGVHLTVSVDNNHCHRYAICQQEAPGIFELSTDGRLTYSAMPDVRRLEAVRRAARLCPMQAITIREVHR